MGRLEISLIILSIFIAGIALISAIDETNPYDKDINITGHLSANSFSLNVPVEDDIRISATTIRVGAVSPPTFISFAGGIYAYAFADNKVDNGFINFQLPHANKDKTILQPHFHWSPSDNSLGNVVWCMEYTCANIGELFNQTTTTDCIISNATGTAYRHIITDEINIQNNLTYSAMCNMRIFRNGTQTEDTYTSDAYLLEFDIHVYKDKLGYNP